MNRIHQIIAFLVSLLILLLVFEGGLRLIGFAPKSTMNRFDSALGWAKTPSTAIRRHTGEFDVTFATNSRGLREDESVGYEKPGGTQRVLVVGDSFTLGYTVDRPETITQLLQDELRAIIREGLLELHAINRKGLQEGLRAVATGLAAHKSIDEGRVVQMNEVLPAGW